VVEGAGGLLVPLNDEALVIDLIARLQLPVLLVVRSGLGTINHTLLSLEALRSRQLPILGVVINGPRNPGNRAAIETYGRVPVLAELEPLESITPGSLRGAWASCFPMPST
jgi:dethiobiotin synthetase